MKRILFILVFFAACQPQQNQGRSRPKAVYDRPLLNAVYELAAANDGVFREFKRHPVFNLVQENLSYEEGEAFLKSIAYRTPDLLPHLQKLCRYDLIGSARIYPYEGIGSFSPTTLRHVAFMGRMEEALGGLDGKDVVQIGGGYGGLCCVMKTFGSVKSYTIVDTAAALQLTQRYLNACGIEGVRLIAIEEIKEPLVADVVCSDEGFFECSKPVQDVLLEKILIHAPQGFFVGRQLPKHYGVVSYGPHEVRKKLRKNGVGATVKIDEVFLSLNSFNLSWKKTLICEENGSRMNS